MESIRAERAIVLGSGTSTGIPVIGCDCAICRSTDPRNNRYRASLALAFADGSHLVVDTGPEFRLQALRAGIASLKGVFYTHIHADHCHGFDDLRAFYFRRHQAVTCLVPHIYLDEFRARFAYAFEETGYQGTKPQVSLLPMAEGESVFAGVSYEAIRVPHGHVDTFGFRFGDFAYVTDFKALRPEQIAAWAGRIRIMVASGIHFRTHPTHSTIPETIALFQALGVERGIISHLSHEIDHASVSAMLPSGIELAYDGMTIDL